MRNRLELNWIGKYDKENQINPEPRILIENKKYSYGEDSNNMLIHGDNLLALKSLQQDYTNSIKCIYIDPPFNTGQAFEFYDDNLEHSIWLNLMKPRLEMLRNLLSADGTLFVHIDDDNLGYLQVLLDGIFGKNNRLYIITFKQGSATGHKAINPGCVTTTNFILMYAKDKSKWIPNKIYTPRDRNIRYNQFITNIDEHYSKWEIVNLTMGFALVNGLSEKEARAIIKNSPEKLDDFVFEHSSQVIQLARPSYNDVSAKARELIDKSKKNPQEVFLLKRDNYLDMYFIRGERILFYKNTLKLIDGKYTTGEPLTTLWDDLLPNNLGHEGGVSFRKGKKSEALIKRCLDLTTKEGDLVLDSFLGSGTTAAVAHKMNRHYIGIELGEHAYTHCYTRLKAVVDGEQGGISKLVNWQGGSGFKFYELAPSLLEKSKHGNLVVSDKYNEEMLAQAMAKHEGYTYSPDKNILWKQGFSGDKNYIFTTPGYISVQYLDNIATQLMQDEHLLICAESYDTACVNRHKNIIVRHIPNMLLGRCEWGKDNYDLNIIMQDVSDWSEQDEQDE